MGVGEVQRGDTNGKMGTGPILIDATVLSNLAAAERLDLTGFLRDALYLASAVYEESQGVSLRSGHSV